MFTRYAVIAGLAALVVAASTRPADACGACVCQERGVALDVIPRDYEPLPLNPRVFAILSPDAQVTWTRASDGADVPLTLTPEEGLAGATWIAPVAQLDPGTQYRVTLGSNREVTYKTGQAADTTAPTVVAASVDTPSSTDSCTAVRGAVLHIEKILDDTDTAVVAALDVTGPSQTQRLFFQARPGGAPFAEVFGAATGGELSCITGRALSDAPLGEAHSAKLTVFDAAGNAASIDLPPFELADIAPAGCGGGTTPAATPAVDPIAGQSSGCAVARPPRGGLGAASLLAAFALAGLARRSRRR